MFDDGVADKLHGNGGRDWFFADLDGSDGDDDELKDLKSDDMLEMLFDLP